MEPMSERPERRQASSTITEREPAAYLARARGPGESKMQPKPDPRPSGEPARVVTKEYDVPLDPDVGLPANFVQRRRERLVPWHAVRPDPPVGRA